MCRVVILSIVWRHVAAAPSQLLGTGPRVASRSVGVLERIDTISQRHVDERELRIAVLAELRTAIPFDAFAWLLTDPVTCVGSSPVADVPDLSDLPRVIRAKYLTTVNRWTSLDAGVAATHVGSTSGDRSEVDPWCSMLSSYGICDVASVVLHDAFGCWGFIDLWRRTAPFSREECGTLGALAGSVLPALRRAQLSTFESPSSLDLPGPAVLLLDDDLAVVGQTERSEHHLRVLLPAEAGRAVVPAAALNVAAQLLAVEAGVDDRPAQARVHVPGRAWMTSSAARVAAGSPKGPTIAVSIAPTPPTERASLYGRIAGLTRRETDVLDAIVAGHDSRHAARSLAISEHTLQDHLKSIFAKTRTDSRRLLIARATGASASWA